MDLPAELISDFVVGQARGKLAERMDPDELGQTSADRIASLVETIVGRDRLRFREVIPMADGRTFFDFRVP